MTMPRYTRGGNPADVEIATTMTPTPTIKLSFASETSATAGCGRDPAGCLFEFGSPPITVGLPMVSSRGRRSQAPL